MTISSFLIRIIFLAAPGIVSYMLFRKLAGKNKCEKWEEGCFVVLFSLIIYAIYYIFVWFFVFFGWSKGELVFFNAVLDESVAIRWQEIIIASLIGVPVAFIVSAVHTYKLINKIGRFLHVTRRFGDEDVWNFFHNLPEKQEYEWVYIRDHKTNLLYFGFIHAYSDSEKERELLMGDVDVFSNDNGEFIYKAKMLYICRSRYDLTIEIPLSDKEIKKDQK